MIAPTYMIARTLSNRPSVMHELPNGQASRTSCGVDVSGWSRCFIPQSMALAGLKTMMCGSCDRTRLARSPR